MNKDWSVALEHGEYEDNPSLVIKDAIEAVEKTEPGFYVNLVTPGSLENPETYLSRVLEEHFQDCIKSKFIDQCGCGGFVFRVWKVR